MLQAGENGQGDTLEPELMEEADDEDRRQLRRAPDEAVQLPLQLGRAGLGRAGEARRRRVGGHRLVQPLHRAQRHAPDVLDQPEPEHGRERPQLADGQDRDLLEGGDEAADVGEVDATLAVRDQGDGQLVHPGVAGERAGPKLGELPVVAPRQALAHLGDVLHHDVVVVQEPFARGADVLPRVGRLRQLVLRRGQDAAGLVQPGEQRRRAAGPAAAGQALATGDLAGPFDQMLEAEQVALNGTRDEFLSGIDAAGAETSEDLARTERSDGADLG